MSNSLLPSDEALLQRTIVLLSDRSNQLSEENDRVKTLIAHLTKRLESLISTDPGTKLDPSRPDGM